MARDTEISKPGMLAAVVLTLIGTLGALLTRVRLDFTYDWLWLSLFAGALLLLSASAVNFDPKRILR
jgi:hypothetical protein